MRTATLPFKHKDTDAEWLSAEVLIPETPLDYLRLWFGPYQVGTGAIWGRIHYDPRTVREPSRRGREGG